MVQNLDWKMKFEHDFEKRVSHILESPTASQTEYNFKGFPTVMKFLMSIV